MLTAQPIEPPPARVALLEVRFDSVPSAGVYADGHTAELCRTPCTFHIDPADGGPADHRAFIIRRAGYSDGAVTVDLAGSEREFHVPLRPAGEHADPRPPDKHAVKHPAKATRHSTRDLPGREASTRGPRDAAPEHANAKAPLHAPEAGPTAGPAGGPQDDKPAVPKTPAPAIDPADTLDPFRKK
jgi:hypothetical protein